MELESYFYILDDNKHSRPQGDMDVILATDVEGLFCGWWFMKIFIHHTMVALYTTEKKMLENVSKQSNYDNNILYWLWFVGLRGEWVMSLGCHCTGTCLKYVLFLSTANFNVI